VTIIADDYQGKRLNSPNDPVPHPDGSIWFTDPPYGGQLYEGAPDSPGGPSNPSGRINPRAGQPPEIGSANRELPTNVYRADPSTGVCEQVTDDFDRPNGVAFSLDERVLYVADTGRGHIRALDLVEGRAARDRVFAVVEFGKVDGIRLDATGNVWVAAGPALHCFHPDGTLVGRLRTPEISANLTFGGPKGNRLFVCATTSLYSALLNINGAAHTDPRPATRWAGAGTRGARHRER